MLSIPVLCICNKMTTWKSKLANATNQTKHKIRIGLDKAENIYTWLDVLKRPCRWYIFPTKNAIWVIQKLHAVYPQIVLNPTLCMQLNCLYGNRGKDHGLTNVTRKAIPAYNTKFRNTQVVRPCIVFCCIGMLVALCCRNCHKATMTSSAEELILLLENLIIEGAEKQTWEPKKTILCRRSILVVSRSSGLGPALCSIVLGCWLHCVAEIATKPQWPVQLRSSFFFWKT